MKNIFGILEDLKITIEESSKEALRKAVAENYVAKEEHSNKLGKVEKERDLYREQLATAENTLKGFEGIDPAKIQTELNEWKSKAESAKKDYEAKLAERDSEDAIKAFLESHKFSSTAAKNAIAGELKAAGLKLQNGVLLGANDWIAEKKKSDPDAFVDENAPNRSKFTTPNKGASTGDKVLTRKEISQIKDPVARQKAWETLIESRRKE